MPRFLRWNIPNTISVLRILLIPPFLYLLFRQSYSAALVVCVTAGISDLADGYTARRLKAVTALGAMLDPLADKMLIVGSVLVLAKMGLLPLWIAALILLRDILIVAGAASLYFNTDKPSLAPCLMGKANTLLQFGLILLVLLKQKHLIDGTLAINGTCAATAVTSIISGLIYLWAWLRQIRREKALPVAEKSGDLPEYG